jgi:hypothetical protein
MSSNAGVILHTETGNGKLFCKFPVQTGQKDEIQHNKNFSSATVSNRDVGNGYTTVTRLF